VKENWYDQKEFVEQREMIEGERKSLQSNVNPLRISIILLLAISFLMIELLWGTGGIGCIQSAAVYVTVVLLSHVWKAIAIFLKTRDTFLVASIVSTSAFVLVDYPKIGFIETRENIFSIALFMSAALGLPIVSHLYQWLRKSYQEKYQKCNQTYQENVLRPYYEAWLQKVDKTLKLRYLGRINFSPLKLLQSDLYFRKGKLTKSQFGDAAILYEAIGTFADGAKILASDIHINQILMKNQSKKIFFIQMEFNKTANSKTLILPKGTWMNVSEYQKIETESIEFAKKFDVYSTSQVDARYVLSVSFMERILDYNNRHHQKIRMSIVNQTFYMAIESKESIFFSNLDQTVDQIKKMEYLYEAFAQAFAIRDELNLIYSIWSTTKKVDSYKEYERLVTSEDVGRAVLKTRDDFIEFIKKIIIIGFCGILISLGVFALLNLASGDGSYFWLFAFVGMLLYEMYYRMKKTKP